MQSPGLLPRLAQTRRPSPSAPPSLLLLLLLARRTNHARAFCQPPPPPRHGPHSGHSSPVLLCCPSPASSFSSSPASVPTSVHGDYRNRQNSFPTGKPDRSPSVERVAVCHHGLPHPQGRGAQHARAPRLHREGWRARVALPRHPALCEPGPDRPQHDCRDPAMDQCQARGTRLPPPESDRRRC